jgi:hypothetical protein
MSLWSHAVRKDEADEASFLNIEEEGKHGEGPSGRKIFAVNGVWHPEQKRKIPT